MEAKNYLRNVLVFFLIWSGAITAQTRYYATGTVTSSSSGVTSATNANDGNLATAARLTSKVGIGTNDKYVELTFGTGTTNLPVNTPVYIKVNAESQLLNGLLAGGLGNLLVNLTDILLNGQSIKVEAKNASGTVVTTVSDSNLKVIEDASGNMLIKIIPTAAFKSIRITNTKLGLTSNTMWFDVYDAFYADAASGCGIGAYTSYSASGLISVNAAPTVTDAYKAIDASGATSSKLSLGALSAGYTVEQTVYFEGVATNTDKYKIKLALHNSLVQAGLLQYITIEGYNGTSTTPVYTGTAATLLTADLLGLIQTNGSASITIQPSSAIDRIRISMTGLVNANLLSVPQELNIYSVSRGDFTLTTSGTTSCYVGDTATITAAAAGCSTYTYSWAGGVTSPSSATTTVPTTTPGVYTYTVTATDAYGNQQVATKTVTVLARPVGGTVNSSQTICSGDLAGALTLSGYTGTIVRWEKADNTAFTNATTIANTTATLSSAEIGAVTATTYVRAIITLNSATTPATYATLLVKTSTWNGTSWAGGTPDISTTVIFAGSYSQNANVNACSVTVNNGAVVDFPTGYTLTVNKFVNVATGGSLTFENEAHLIQQTNAINSGVITSKRNSSPLFRLDYTLWSAPVDNQQLYAFSPATSNDRFYEYKYGLNPSTNTYREQYFTVNPATTYFETGKSFLIRMPNANAAAGYNAGTTSIVMPGIFTGAPHNGTITKALSSVGDRYTAIGNPYPSPINVLAFFDANQSIMDDGAAIYFWRKKNNTNATSYAVLTRDAYVYNHAVGGNSGEDQYGGEQWASYFNTTNSANWTINTGQGFIIRTKTGVSNPVATFTNSMRRGTMHANQFFREEATKSRFWINVEGSAAWSQMAVVYAADATLGLDAARDAQRMDNAATAMYTIVDDKSLVVQARPEFDDNDVVTTGFITTTAGQFTVTLDSFDGIFADGQTIYIKDNMLGITHNLSESAYTFTSEVGTFNNRFQIVYTTDAALGTQQNALDPNAVVLYQSNGAINITAQGTTITAVDAFDIRGRKLYSKSGINADSFTVSGLTVQHEMIIVQVTTDKGIVSKKMIL